MTGTQKTAKRTKGKQTMVNSLTQIPAVSVQGKYFCRVDRTYLAKFEVDFKIGIGGKGQLGCLIAPRGIED